MRLFVAIQLEEPMKDALCANIQRLQTAALQGSFTRRQNLHLTLAFIGETNRLQAAQEAVRGVVAAPFALTLGAPGRFRRPDGDLCWMGVQHSEALLALQAQVAWRLTDAGFALEKRAFTPHVTLGRRVKLPPGFDWAALEQPNTNPPASMTVGRVSLMLSENIGGKLTYTELLAKPLTEGGA